MTQLSALFESAQTVFYLTAVTTDMWPTTETTTHMVSMCSVGQNMNTYQKNTFMCKPVVVRSFTILKKNLNINHNVTKNSQESFTSLQNLYNPYTNINISLFVITNLDNLLSYIEAFTLSPIKLCGKRPL